MCHSPLKIVVRMNNFSLRDLLAPTLSLFTSASTLICCALPALLVSIGAGASLAGFMGVFPELAILSKNKEILFTVAAVMLIFAGILRYRARNAPCPIDPTQAKACMRLRKVSAWIYYISIVLYFIGFFFAFIAVHIFY